MNLNFLCMNFSVTNNLFTILVVFDTASFIKNKTSYEILHNHSPDLNHLNLGV